MRSAKEPLAQNISASHTLFLGDRSSTNQMPSLPDFQLFGQAVREIIRWWGVTRSVPLYPPISTLTNTVALSISRRWRVAQQGRQCACSRAGDDSADSA
jgi:hypothetical protein